MNKLLFWGMILCLWLAGCSGSGNPVNRPADNSDPIPPGKDWLVSTPVEMGLDQERLDQMLDHIEETNLDLHALLVIRNGSIVLEKYYPGHSPDELHVLYSVTKSFVSTLFGIAFDQGKIKGVDQAVSSYFGGLEFAHPDPRKDSLSLENLLTMTSGLDWVESDPTYSAMYASSNWVGWVMGLPMETDPGSTFVYCSGCSHVLLKVVEQAAGADGVDFADEYLLNPIGITRYEWERTPQGDPIGGWGLYLTARDMARLGYLYLHDGMWGDRQVVSESWVEAATQKRVDTGGRLGYGYQWWIYPTHNAYAALGRDGQTIFVIPDFDLIVVTTARINGHDPVFELIDQYIIPAVEK